MEEKKERKLWFPKLRGGRPTAPHKDKTKYDRKRDKKDIERDIR